MAAGVHSSRSIPPSLDACIHHILIHYFCVRLQLVPKETPIADDVDFGALGEHYELTGGAIKNSVFRAAVEVALWHVNQHRLHHRHNMPNSAAMRRRRAFCPTRANVS